VTSLRLGTSLRNGGADAREAVRRLPELAVELGLDTVWASDHVVAPPEIAERYSATWLDPVVVLSGVAERYPSLGLGISALVLPCRPVLPTAKALSTLQSMSYGRLVVAVGSGWSEQEYAALGVPFAARGRLTDEGITGLQAAWQRDDLDPRDAVPLLAAGNGAAALRRAAVVGGWHPIAVTPVQVAAGMSTLPAGTRCVVRSRVGLGHERGDRPLFGTPDQVRDDVIAYTDAGVTDLLLDHSAPSLDEAEAQLRRFVKEVEWQS
jgi:alkanesulfonate monooxygenase SsuD/methylene tetrahydromethanopterin reductase-like flavin-dependent oxidoreductase (luciferase family)